MHRRVATNQTEGKVVTLNMKQHDGLAGAITRDKNAVMPGSVYTSPLPDLLKDISDNMVVSAAISPPAMPPGYVFQSRILPGVRLPKPVRAWMGRDGARLESAESTLSVSHLSARARRAAPRPGTVAARAVWDRPGRPGPRRRRAARRTERVQSQHAAGARRWPPSGVPGARASAAVQQRRRSG